MSPKMYRLFAVVIVQCFVFGVSSGNTTQTAWTPSAPALAACYGPNAFIYCYGPLLDQIQSAKPFNDSKTFVDMAVRADRQPEQVYLNFLQQTNNGTRRMDVDEVRQFLADNFQPVNTEFETFTPVDWKPNPTILDRIRNPVYKAFASSLNVIWKHLGRKVRDEVRQNPQRYSLIYVPEPFIVPGGRFREFYYWDSYWSMQGLLLSEMYTTVRGMLINFADIIRQLGHIPNGNRVYYNQRSQPPMFTLMVRDYVDATNDLATLRQLMPALVKEYQFWLQNRTVTIKYSADKTFALAQYNMPLGSPRPESYAEDVETAENATDNAQRSTLYGNLGSAAESGWDFSLRWLSEADRNDESRSTLANIMISSLIPVDLNALLCDVEQTLAYLSDLIGTDSRHYYAQAQARHEAIATLLWNETEGTWFDYDLNQSKHNRGFYLSNYVPLYAMCGFPGVSKVGIANPVVVKRIREFLASSSVNVLSAFPGGVPTSLDNTGQQWDYPNAWAPLQHMLYEGLRKASESQETTTLARQLAENWVYSNYVGFNRTGNMFEKYIATAPGQHGSGGEYDVQEGFGWTNGVAMYFMNLYGATL